MPEKIAENLYKIEVPLPGNPLKILNSYYIKGDESDLLIDTGFRREECREALFAGLKELGADIERLDVMTTHFHADHSGLVREVCGEYRKIYMSTEGIFRTKRFLSGATMAERHDRFVEEGFPEELLVLTNPKNPKANYSVDEVDERFTAFDPGDKITVGEYTLEAIDASGHCPGNLMLWCEKQKIMFTGDHVLFDISPNITAWWNVKDTLGDYLENLESAKAFPVELALPGHRKSGDYQARIEELLKHHEKRLADCVNILKEHPGLNAYDLTGKMRWKIRARNWEEFPAVQKWFAVGECMAHLDHLIVQGRVKQEWNEELKQYNYFAL